MRHVSREHAAIALRRVNIASMRTYKCPKCKGWHLGNSSRAVDRQARIMQLLDDVMKRVTPVTQK